MKDISQYDLVVALIGLVLYVIGSELWKRPTLAEIGRIMLFAGLLAHLLRG